MDSTYIAHTIIQMEALLFEKTIKSNGFVNRRSGVRVPFSAIKIPLIFGILTLKNRAGGYQKARNIAYGIAYKPSNCQFRLCLNRGGAFFMGLPVLARRITPRSWNWWAFLFIRHTCTVPDRGVTYWLVGRTQLADTVPGAMPIFN